MNKEIRVLDFKNISDEDLIIEGYAATFNQPTVLYRIDGVEYKEVISPEAFKDADMRDCCLKYNHQSGVPILARTRGGSLELRTDKIGLFFRANVFPTQTGKDVHMLVKGGALDKASFAFTIAEGGDEYDRTSRTRTIKKVEKLWDVAIVDIPAYDSTSVYARNFFEAEAEKEKREMAEAARRDELMAELKRKVGI